MRRHYLQAFDEKLAAFFQPIRQSRFEGRRDGRGDISRNRGYPGVRSPKTPIPASDVLRGTGRVRRARLAIGEPHEIRERAGSECEIGSRDVCHPVSVAMGTEMMGNRMPDTSLPSAGKTEMPILAVTLTSWP